MKENPLATICVAWVTGSTTWGPQWP